MIDPRFLCNVEAASRHHPNKTVCILLHLPPHSSTINKLSKSLFQLNLNFQEQQVKYLLDIRLYHESYLLCTWIYKTWQLLVFYHTKLQKKASTPSELDIGEEYETQNNIRVLSLNLDQIFEWSPLHDWWREDLRYTLSIWKSVHLSDVAR